jgi:acyl-CoA hydrolase
MMQRELTLRFLAEPSEVNFGGKVHGGTVMKWIDQAGYACAVGWSGLYCVTVYVGGIRFLSPIRIGELVEVNAKVIHTGNTSLHISVDVYARDPKAGEPNKTTHCIIVFVAVDQDGVPTAVNPWVPVDETDVALQNYAQRLMDLRRSIEAEMSHFR